MKLNTLTVIVAAGLLAAGTAFAQRGAGTGGGQGKGYGGPPQSAEERAARQAACLEKNGGVCPQGGPGANCQGKGKGQGQGNQGRHGARDGTGPRAGTGACPVNPGTAQK
jgi:hypothetical protein